MFGRTTLPQAVGRNEQVLAEPHSAHWLPIGAQIYWDGISAAGSDTVLDDGTPVYAGEKAIVRGTVLTRNTGTPNVQTLSKSTSGNAWTGGTFTLTFTHAGRTETTADLAYNISADDLQLALEALPNIGPGKVTVAYSSPDYTITFNANMANIGTNAAAGLLVSDVTNIVGGTPTGVVVNTTPGVIGDGLYLPCKTNVSGITTLTRDYCGILNTTLKERELSIMGGYVESALAGLLIGGTIWYERLVCNETVSGGNNPTLANIRTAMPLIEIMYGDR